VTVTISPNTKSILKSLRKSQLVGFSVDPNHLWVRLEFTYGTFGGEADTVVIQLTQLIHFILSKNPDDDDDDWCFFVCEIKLTPVEDGGKEILSSLGHRLREADGTVASYSSHSLFHFYLEGGVCIEAVCGSYQVSQEIQ
jgi:hypothetical protein